MINLFKSEVIGKASEFVRKILYENYIFQNVANYNKKKDMSIFGNFNKKNMNQVTKSSIFSVNSSKSPRFCNNSYSPVRNSLHMPLKTSEAFWNPKNTHTSKNSIFPLNNKPNISQEHNKQNKNKIKLHSIFQTKQTNKSSTNSLFEPKSHQNFLDQSKIDKMEKEMIQKDIKIKYLENQVQVLNQSMAKCMQLLQEMRKHQNQNQNTIKSKSMSNEINILKNFGQVYLKSESEMIIRDSTTYLYLKFAEKLQNQKKLKIQNQHAKIIFDVPINLSKIKNSISKWTIMQNDQINLLQPELQNKSYEVFIKNFKNYLNCQNAREKQQIIDEVNRLKLDTRLENVQFKFETGLFYSKYKATQ